MKHVFVTLLLMASIGLCKAQKNLDEYKASNGVTYHAGDTIKLGRGSANNGDFLWLQMGGWAAAASYDASKGSDQNNIGKGYSGLNVVLKKIKSAKWKGAEKVYFIVGGGNITNYYLYIEDAITSCEVAACKDSKQVQAAPTADKFDQLKKLKALKDEGVLSEEEYNAEKKKLLDQ